jgi:hypothetical protein
MFKRENAPYLFTLIIATLGWLLTRAVDEMTKSPLVGYSVHDSVDAQGLREFSVRVHNISAATAFRNLYLVLTNLDGVRSKFTQADIQYEPPVHVSKERKTVAEWGNTWAGAQLKELQPQTAIRLATQIEGPDDPVVRFESATDTVRLVKDGWLTYAVEHEMELLLWFAGGLVALLLFYVICLAKGKPAAAGPVAAAALVLATSGLCSAGTIRVVEDGTGRGVPCEIFREDRDAHRHLVGHTSPNGVYSLKERGKSGEKYIALSEDYNPGSVECPLADATIRVRKTVWLADHLKKAEFLNSADAPAAAALEFRRAALIAEKKQNTVLFNQLEYHVVETTAKALRVEQPFVETPGGVRSSTALKDTVQAYQRTRDLKPTGALNSDTIRDLAVTTIPSRTEAVARNRRTPSKESLPKKI